MNFDEQRQKAREIAEALYDSTQDATDRNKRKAFVHDAEEAWFKTTEPGASITVRESRTYAEINDRWFGGSITVSRPERRGEYRDRQFVPEIKCGRINASSWEAGNYRADSWTTQREMEHRLRMMALAVDLLNAYNAVVLDWTPVADPFRKVEELEERVSHLQKREAEAVRVAAEKEAKRNARRAS